MEAYLYVGDPQNLGHHGWVEPNTVLQLTPGEVDRVAKDPRFKPYRPSPKVNPVAVEEFTQDQIIKAELEEKDRSKLMVLASEMAGKGYPVKLPARATDGMIRRILIEALRFHPRRYVGPQRARFEELDKLSVSELQARCAALAAKGMAVSWNVELAQKELIATIIAAETSIPAPYDDAETEPPKPRKK